MSDQVQLTCYSITKNQFDTSTHARDIEFSGILQSDWARTSWTKKSSPWIFPEMKSGMGSQVSQ